MDITTHRRALHRIPELELHLPETMAYLRSVLAELPCRVFSPTAHSLCAFFDFGRDTALAFRADCDGLPIREQTSHDFPSTHPGIMHACGHDGHMAILLELARRLSLEKDLPHNILLIFQPGEESPGGAKAICDSGVLRTHRVRSIFGLHLWPGLEQGQIFSREQELMSRSAEVDLDIRGHSAHIGRGWEGRDALAAAIEFYTRATALEQSLPSGVFRLLKFGKLCSGQARNAISDHSHMAGSLRAFQDDVFEFLADGLRSIARAVSEETGCVLTLRFSDGYPAIWNPPELCRRVMQAAPYHTLSEPSMTSEDFSWYQRSAPGMFFFLGLGRGPALHTADFDFDESVLSVGADYFLSLAKHFSPEDCL